MRQAVVAESFEAVVNQPGKDALVLFYSPSCPHCKRLEPVYRELAQKVPPSAPAPSHRLLMLICGCVLAGGGA